MNKEIKCGKCKWHENCICVVCEEGNTVVCTKRHKHMQKDDSCDMAELQRDIRGGKRENAGRKPSGKRKRNYYVTDQEHEEIKKLIERLRKPL